MKSVAIFCLVIAFASTSPALTQSELIERTRALVKRQKTELDDAKKSLLLSKNLNGALNNLLDQKEKEFEETVKKWVDYGDDQHARWMNAEQRVTDAKADLKKLHDQVDGHWGLDAILYGIKRLATHLLILAGVLVVAGILIAIFVPAAGPVLKMLKAILDRVIGAIANFVTNLFKKKNP